MNISNVSRRNFIKTMGFTGGGLVLGTSLLGCSSGSEPDALPELIATQGTPRELDVFVQIGEDNLVYITAHRSEMGQGIRTGLPQIVADELEADWDKVRIIQALGDKKYGSQNTDGSRSVRRFYTRMREAGASARQMLVQAAANAWRVPVAECLAINHQVIHQSSNRALSYGKLAKLASGLAVPDPKTLKLKAKSDFKYIGKPITIVDLPDMVVGKSQYGIDTQIPGMVYASIERCPVIGGSVKKFDSTTAKSLPGVLDIIEIKGKDAPPLFHALPGVAVIASNTWSAINARKKLQIDWELGENQTHDSKKYLEQLKTSVQENGDIIRERGSVNSVWKTNPEQITATYSTSYLSHAPMEPPAATVWFHDEICEVWACVQDPQGTHQTVAQELGLKPENIKVNVTLLGGAFGRKSKPDFVVEAALLAQQLGKPVKVTWTREDDIQFDYYHATSAQYYQAALNEKGGVEAWLQRSAFPSISSTFSPDSKGPADFELGLGFGDVPFDIENLCCEKLPAKSHIRIGWLRSVSNIHHAFGVGSFVDEVAHLTKKNSKQMWLELIGKDRRVDLEKEGYQFKYGNYGESLEKFPIDTSRYKNVIELVTRKAGWDKTLPKGEAWGLSAHRSFLTYVAVATRVKVNNGQLQIKEIHCAADCGTVVNPDRVSAQMEGAMIFGMSLALFGDIQVEAGAVKQSNFHDYQMLRMNQCPDINVHLVESDEVPAGVGEPGVPPVAPSIANAIFAATGKRIRDLPLNKSIKVT